ncbi:uncharacterized protein LOC120380290 isoform X3 [Mauremys reevesii]|uniref:uncharacterized protein LOC120380290 isoform X3 n=1 Tax=Mauremys reevesii TaxID=260615 RepID=UPI00193F460E|nr:uncharacterized protein LOC120380290 isoform X3 [Mauremys reevesii]
MPHHATWRCSGMVQVQSLPAERRTENKNPKSNPSPPEQTSFPSVIFKTTLHSWDAAVWTLCQELQQVGRENQSLGECVEDLTKRVSAMESRLAALKQAPAVAGHPTGTLLIPKVEEIQIPLAEMDEIRAMDCGRTGTDLPAGHPEAVESGEVPSTPEGQSLPHNLPAAASIPDSSLLCISPEEDRRLFEEAEGDIAKYALAVFRHTMPQDYYQQWRGKANVSGTHQKAALSPNLVNAAFKGAKRWKPKLAGKDYSNIKIQINNLMRSRKSRSLVESTGQM